MEYPVETEVIAVQLSMQVVGNNQSAICSISSQPMNAEAPLILSR